MDGWIYVSICEPVYVSTYLSMYLCMYRTYVVAVNDTKGRSSEDTRDEGLCRQLQNLVCDGRVPRCSVVFENGHTCGWMDGWMDGLVNARAYMEIRLGVDVFMCTYVHTYLGR